MKPAWISKLKDGAEQIGVPLDDPAALRLATFSDRLIEWGAKMDLTSIKDPDEILEKHFLDSLLGMPHFAKSGTLVDLGSGAGFPGLVLAAVRPDLKVISVESRSKKGAFQRQVVRDLKLTNTGILTERGEDIVAKQGAPEWVTARALADLAALVGIVKPWLVKGTTLVAYKSSGADAEIAALVGHTDLRVTLSDEVRLPFSKDPRRFVLVCST